MNATKVLLESDCTYIFNIKVNKKVTGSLFVKEVVTRIRKKLGQDVITTIRGLGYSLDEPGARPVE